MSDDWWNPKPEFQPPRTEPAAPPSTPAAGPPPTPPQPVADWQPDPAPPGPAPPWVEQPPTQRPPPRPRRALLAIVGGIASIITIIAIKIGAGLLVGTVATSIAGAFFGGPFDRLPPDLRQQYEQRLQTAIGSRLDGVHGQARDQQVQNWITGGLLRMDDARLVHRFQLEVDAIFAVDEPTCAGFARQAFTGEQSTDISRRVLNALDTAKLGDWIGMNVEAIEVELKATPDQQRASDAAIDGAFDRLIDTIAEPTAKTIIALADGIPASDAESCSALRTFYGAAMHLDETSRSVIARYDVQSLE